MRYTFACAVCGTETEASRGPGQPPPKYCGSKCYGRARSKRFRGPESPTWKGGRTIHNGYVRVYIGRKKRYEFEHRLVMEQSLGRPLAATEVVHHKNGDKQDNRPENLEVMNRARHASEHYTDTLATATPLTRWSRGYDACITCGTTDRRHGGRGMCVNCYRGWLIRQRPAGRWARDHERCRDCGTTERRHVARGLCDPCYQRQRNH